MYCRNVFFILFMIAATIVPGMSRAADDEAVVETFSHAKPISARETPALSSPGLQLGTSAVAAYTVSVDPQTIAAEVARVRAQDLDSKVKMIGAHIHLPEIGTEKWEHLTGPDGAHSWRLAIRSAGAVTLRAHFTGYDPARRVVVYADPSADAAREARPTKTATTPDFWGPPVAGETMYIEVVTQSETPPVELVDKISHVFEDVVQKEANGTCYLDPSCYDKWTDVQKSVGQMYFEVTAQGGKAVCTGTLIMDIGETYKPWFISAHHCISSESDADTLEVSFFYHTESCNGEPISWSLAPYTQGSEIYYTADSDEEIDITLFLLDEEPPDGTVYSGWTTAGQSGNDDVTVLHHPAGDYMRISFGGVIAVWPIGSDYYSGFWEVKYNESSTEPGSSGAGLFTGNEQLIGTLSAGDAACDNMSGSDLYGQFKAGWEDGLAEVLGGSGDDDASTGGTGDGSADDEDDKFCGCGD